MKESRINDLNKKLKKKIEECDSFIDFTSKATKELNTTGKKILLAKENLKSAKYNAQWNKNVFKNFKELEVYKWDPDFNNYLKAYETGVTGIKDFSKEIMGAINRIEKESDFITGATSTSDVNMRIGHNILGNYFNDNRNNEIIRTIELQNPWDNPFNSRDSLKEELLPIKEHLTNTLDNLWDSLLFEGRKEENRPPTLLMREFISDFLHTLTSRDDILKLDWCRTSDRGNPTQPSMVINIIFGSKKDFNWENKTYKPIVEIATRYREIYQILNRYTHYRGDGTPTDVKIELKSFAEQIQSYTLEILKLREIYSN